jgi:HEAT repeat protein
LVIVVLLMLTSGAFAQTVKELVAKFPVKNVGDEAALVEQILKLGPAGVKEVCAMVQPPGSTDDSAVRFAVSGLMRQAGRPGAEEQRTIVASGIAQSIDAADDTEVKSFLILRLQEIGKDESVAPVAKYLSDEKLCPVACAALERIGTPAAVEAIAKALPRADDARRVPIIKSLGALRVQSSAPEIAKSVSASDAKVKETAIWALVNMGSELAIEPVNTYAKEAKGAQMHQALAWMLLVARREAEAGKADEAVNTCRAILTMVGGDAKYVHAAGAALHLLADVRGEAALDALAKAARSDEIQIRAAALDAAAPFRSAAATDRWVQELKAGEGSPAAKVDLLAFLGGRGDAAALPAVIETTRAQDAQVRLAAALAAAKLDPQKAVEPLVAMVVNGPAGEARPVADVLARMKGQRSLDALAGAIKAAPAEAKVVILEVLASRMDKQNKPAVIEQTSSDNHEVRLAALRAMERVGDANDVSRLVEIALGANDEAEEQAALKAAGAAGAGVANADERARPLLAALSKAQGNKRVAIERALAKVGGRQALDAVVADLKEPATREGAIRALAEWADASAVAPLLDVAQAKQTPEKQVVLALRGAVNVTKASQLSPEEKVKHYGKALAAAKRQDEKKLVLGALAAERTSEALDLVAPLLDDESLKSEAALAVVKIVAPTERRQRGLTGERAIEALRKAIPLCPDAAARADAERYLNRVAPKK